MAAASRQSEKGKEWILPSSLQQGTQPCHTVRLAQWDPLGTCALQKAERLKECSKSLSLCLFVTAAVGSLYTILLKFATPSSHSDPPFLASFLIVSYLAFLIFQVFHFPASTIEKYKGGKSYGWGRLNQPTGSAKDDGVDPWYHYPSSRCWEREYVPRGTTVNQAIKRKDIHLLLWHHLGAPPGRQRESGEECWNAGRKLAPGRIKWISKRLPSSKVIDEIYGLSSYRALEKTTVPQSPSAPSRALYWNETSRAFFFPLILSSPLIRL